jgi:biopolymer transport protein ExbB/TolQ
MLPVASIAKISERLLCSAVVWGTLLWLLVYAIVSSSYVNSAVLDKYLLNHWIEKVTMLLFCIAVMSLVIRGISLVKEFVALEKVSLEAPRPGGATVDEAPRYLSQIDRLPGLLADSYMARRLRDAIDYVIRKDSAETLESRMRHLESVDLERMSANFATPRLMMWAIPVLGFLGTVMGITLAIAKLKPDALEDSIDLVTADLGLAFDTTTLSLTLSIVIGLAKFAVERIEAGLLEKVDQRAERELIGRFQAFGTSSDPNVASVRRMAEQVVRSVERMATEQAAVLRDAIDDGHSHWVEVAKATGNIIDNALATTLHDNLERHAQTLSNGVDRQLSALRGTLESHAALLNAGAEKQINLLSEGVERGNLAVIEQLAEMARHITREMSSLSEVSTQQLDLFRQSVSTQTDKLNSGTSELIEKLRGGLQHMAELLVEALQNHGETLVANEQELAQSNRKHLAEVEAALGEAMVVAADRQERLVERTESMLAQFSNWLEQSAKSSSEQVSELAKQSEVLLKVVDSTGYVLQLEESLNQNLASLGRVHNFEETLLSLSAAIQLLSARVGNEAKPHSRHLTPQQAA